MLRAQIRALPSPKHIRACKPRFVCFGVPKMHVLEPQISVLWSPKTHAVNLTHECSRMSRICVLSPTYCWFKAQTSVLHHPEYRCCKPQVCALQPQLRVVLSPKSMPCALFRALLCARHFPKALLGAEGDKKKQPNKQGMQKKKTMRENRSRPFVHSELWHGFGKSQPGGKSLPGCGAVP